MSMSKMIIIPGIIALAFFGPMIWANDNKCSPIKRIGSIISIMIIFMMVIIIPIIVLSIIPFESIDNKLLSTIDYLRNMI